MKHKKLTIGLILLVLVVVVGTLTYRNRLQTATTYEDAGGWVYKCSRAIRVKDQGVKYMSGKPSLTPVDQAEANKYCHSIGIE